MIILSISRAINLNYKRLEKKWIKYKETGEESISILEGNKVNEIIQESDIAIEVNDLTKSFGSGENRVDAVKGLSLKVRKGEIFGFLGPNGAGKTTSLKMMVGLLEPNRGNVKIFGMNPKDGNKNQLKRLIGIIPQEISLYQELTVQENLWFIADAYRIEKGVAKKRIDELIKAMGLEDKRKALAKNLSGGLRRRLNLIMGLVHDPQLILCDEPTPGLDPQSRVVVWDYIRNLPKKGKTVILTTHHMEEADRLSDRVAIIDHGEILVLDRPSLLKASIGEGDLVEFTFTKRDSETLTQITEVLKQFNSGTNVEDVFVTGDKIVLRALNIVPRLSRIMNYLSEKGAEIENMAIRNTTLEDVFISLTGRALRD